MKTILFLVLSLAVFHQAVFSQIAGPWLNVDPDTVNKDLAIQEALIFGANYAIQQGIENGTIGDTTYEIINIFSVREQIVDGTNYEFVIELTDDHVYYVKLTYIVWVQVWKDSKKVTSFEFSPLLQEGEADFNTEFSFLPEEVGGDSRVLTAAPEDEDEGETAIGGEWTPVDPSELKTDSDLENAYDFGLQQAIQTIINNGGLPNQTYEEDQIYRIDSQVVSGDNYKFDVQVKGNGGAIARIIFVVESQTWTGTLELISSDLISLSN